MEAAWEAAAPTRASAKAADTDSAQGIVTQKGCERIAATTEALEDLVGVGKAVHAASTEPTSGSTAIAGDTVLAVPVVGGPLFRIGEHLIGLSNRFEFGLSRVACFWVLIRVPLDGQFVVRLLDLSLRGYARDAKLYVVCVVHNARAADGTLFCCDGS